MITIEVTNCKPSQHVTIKGNFDVFFPELKLKIKECRLVKKKATEDYFIGFPSQKVNESWITHVFMEDSEYTKEILDQAILGMLEKQREAI